MKKTKKLSPKNDISKEIRHLGVMIESVGDDVKLVAEQYGGMADDIGGIKKTLDSHTEMIGSLSVNLSIVKEDIEFIKGSLKKKIDIDEFSALERRVSLLEKHTTRK